MISKKAYLPPKQQLALEYKPKLKELREQYRQVITAIGEPELESDVGQVFSQLGFEHHAVANQRANVLISIISRSLNHGQLVLLLHRPKARDFTLTSLLREIKKLVPQASFKSLVPIFMGTITSKRQQEMFRMLGQFGVRFACFLTPNAVAGKNIEELMRSLVEFNGLVKSGFVLEETKGVEAKEVDTASIEKYKALLAKGEELMQASNFVEAIEVFSEAMELRPDYGLLIKRGDAYYKSGKYTLALKDYREALKLEHSQSRPYEKIGMCCFNLVKEAVKKKDVKKAGDWFDRGMDSLGKAMEMIDAMLTENVAYPERIPRMPYHEISAAVVQLDVRDTGLKGAEERLSAFTHKLFDKTKKTDYLDPDIDIPIRLNRGILLVRNGFFKDAEEIFQKAVTEKPEIAYSALSGFANEMRKSGMYDRAFEVYLELLRYKVPDRNGVLEQFRVTGVIHAAKLREEFKMDEAIGVYKKILMQKPRGREWVLCELAMANIEMMDQSSASSRLMEAIYINPKLMNSEQFLKYTDLKSLGEEMMKKLNECIGGKDIR